MAARALPVPRASRVRLAVLRAWVWTMALRPAYVLGALVLVQWLALVGLVASIHHNGWLFYQGGDQTFYYTAAWGISGGHLPQTAIGYGWTLLLSPIALFAGPSYLAAVPAVVLLQVLVLLPLGLLFAYGVGERIAGRWLGYVVAAGWVVAPYLATAGFVQRFHTQWVEQFLPQGLGLTGLSDFTAMVATTGAAWLFLRALDTRGTGDAVLAGLLTGLSIGIKPADVLFLGGPLLALAAARRWRTGLVYGAALAPGVLALAVWKERGLGHLPLLAVTVVRLAAAGAASVAPPLGLALPTSLSLDWHQLGQNMAQIREFFWSMRLVELLPFAGVAAVARISSTKALFLGGWLAAFVLVKGTSPRANVQDGTFFRLLMPAWPAYLVLAAALPLLVPGVARAVGTRLTALRPIALRSRSVAVAGVLIGAVPLLLLLALPTLRDRSIVSEFTNNVIVPVGGDFDLRATRTGNRVSLTWRRPSGAHGRVFYRLYRSTTFGQPPLGGLTPISDGISCIPGNRGAAACRIVMDPVRIATETRAADTIPFAGAWSYRVGLMANWLDDPSRGDVLLISPPVRVAVPR